MGSDDKLTNDAFLARVIFRDAAYADSHGADPQAGHLGAGLLYYAIAHALRAKLCVCLGSGGAFVPRLMRQAQRDLALAGSRTVLIDANTGDWRRPEWLAEGSTFRSTYPEVEILNERTAVVARSDAARDWRIDYLHIDADHSHEGSLEDFENYKGLLSPEGVITFHDTRPYEYYNTTCWKALEDIRAQGHHVIDLPWIGAGTALIQLRRGPEHMTPYTPLHGRYLKSVLGQWRKSLRRRFLGE